MTAVSPWPRQAIAVLLVLAGLIAALHAAAVALAIHQTTTTAPAREPVTS